ncbi:histone H2A-Bbd type 2/3-like [Arvicola amphibius]|uniref:histone H2A-Bbd type 2/3-like n=1 Tax=Arvicola amphibius TaxID=1047088 RepID=UPI0018E2C581|nr:histone H2A-Bbd type 2/3-like [Arvicola amphibius]
MPRTRESSHQGSSSHPSHTSRAQLTFSVSLVEHHLRESSHAPWLSEGSPIFLTAILEFLIHRLLKLAGNEVQHRSAQRLITPELMDMAVYNRTQLSDLFQFIIISKVTPAH